MNIVKLLLTFFRAETRLFEVRVSEEMRKFLGK